MFIRPQWQRSKPNFTIHYVSQSRSVIIHDSFVVAARAAPFKRSHFSLSYFLMSLVIPTHQSTPALLKHVLLSEILSVTSTMRKNLRWASSTPVMFVRDSPALGTNMGLRISSPARQTRRSGRGSREAELMAGFIELKRGVKDMKGWTHSLCYPIV